MKPDLTPLRAGDPKEFDGWKLRGIIGEGGFSTIYLAEKNLQQAALKMIRKENLHDQLAVERFFTEIKNLELLNHPNIAKYVESNTSTGVPYFAVEYIDGVTLDKFVELNGPISGTEWFELALSLSQTLSYCHSKEIIHKDVSPGNIVMGKQGPVFIDFGLSYLEKDPRLTSVELSVGTPPFMSPEQFGSERSNLMDVFSLAGTLIYAGTGHYPFKGNTKSEWQESISFDEPNFELLSDDQRNLLTPLLYKETSDRLPLEVFIAALKDNLGTENLSSENSKILSSFQEKAESKLVKKKNANQHLNFNYRKTRFFIYSIGIIGLIILAALGLQFLNSPVSPKSSSKPILSSGSPQIQEEANSRIVGADSSPTASPSPSKSASPSNAGSKTQTPAPSPSSTAFSLSLPISKKVLTDEIFGRVFKSGLDWQIPLSPFSTENVPPITGVQFRLIGYPNADWLGIPYRLKTSNGGVYAQVDDLLFAVMFKKDVCPEFRFIQESGGEIVKIWNKGQPECATDFIP